MIVSQQTLPLISTQYIHNMKSNLISLVFFRCEPCAKGKYQSLYGQRWCLACPTGTYQDQKGSDRCIACPKGSYASNGGGSECQKCKPGYYQPLAGQRGCLNCDPGYYQVSLGNMCKLFMILVLSFTIYVHKNLHEHDLPSRCLYFPNFRNFTL